MSTRKRVVDFASVGEPPQKIRKDVETVQFIIYDFKDRTEKRNEYIESPILKAHGIEWRIEIYPRGISKSSTDQEKISLFLCPKNDVTATFSFRCKNVSARSDIKRRIPTAGRGWSDYLKRDRAIAKYLEEDGSLVIECDIEIDKRKRVWYPQELQQQGIWIELYQDASSETSDIVFSVGEKEFRVHKLILSLRGKILYEIAKDCDSDVPIPLHSVSAEVFKSILDFVYTVKMPEIENNDIATELLVAADRFDCVHIKLYVESVIVDKFLTAENAAEFLIVADSYSCALLKEAAINLFVSNTKTTNNSWSKIRESNKLLIELFLASSNNIDETSEIDRMDVTTLREELGEANLELDGSREVLVNRLNAHRTGQDKE